MYLANRGVKVANLPLIPGIILPPELSRVPVRKVVGLTISPAKLGQIRKERERTMGVRGETEYSDPRRIREELGFADQLFRELGCEVIDVTDRAVEETAAVVMELVRVFRSSAS
jgi:regulator of PEP synthase PpsR (kinase-PPPase family)